MPALTTDDTVTVDCIPHAQFALSTMEKVMPVYERMFDLEYPLPKLDLLAVSARTDVVKWCLHADEYVPGRPATSTLVVWRTGYVLPLPSKHDVLYGASPQGLIVGRTQYLLHDPESNDIQNEQSVASMVGHEVAHMWCVQQACSG